MVIFVMNNLPTMMGYSFFRPHMYIGSNNASDCDFVVTQVFS